MDTLLDKIEGSLIGGAVGDALGYPVEFWDYGKILMKYGEGGITSFELKNGEAEISDDTQMTLYTACGLLNGYEAGFTIKNPEEMARDYIWEAYKEWYSLQITRHSQIRNPLCFISSLTAMQAWRAPGMTCMHALKDGKQGSLSWHVNDSKGCGGIMRVAPVALLNEPHSSSEDKARLAAEASALTHGHSLGFLPSAVLVYLLNEIVYPSRDWKSLAEVIEYTLGQIHKIYGKQYARTGYMLQLVRHAMELAGRNQSVTDERVISMLGEGKVAEETLAIAVYCSLKYSDSFEKAIIASVNHGGDSDSTGAVTGNLLGAWLGVKAIPHQFRYHVEAAGTIEDIAERLLLRTQGTS